MTDNNATLTPAPAVRVRDSYGALPQTPDWVRALLTDLDDGIAWTTGITSDRKRRGSAINTALYSYDESRGLAVVQVRQCVFHPRRFSEVRKNYFLIGRNESGRAFAHPIEARAGGRMVSADLGAGVRLALMRIWACDEEDLVDIIRNGDVAFVPVGRLPEGAEAVAENAVMIRDSHHVRALAGAQLFRLGEIYYVRGRAKIEHTKHQHPTARVRGGIWRVQPAVRGSIWDFARYTAD